MNIIRAFQVINQDGQYILSTTYNKINNFGEIESRNEKDSFYAVDTELKSAISFIEKYIDNNRLNSIGEN